MIAHSIKRSFIILGIIATFAFFFVRLSAERFEKKAKEIESSSYSKPFCEQYALVAFSNGWFPCFRCGGRDSIYLYEGEV